MNRVSPLLVLFVITTACGTDSVHLGGERRSEDNGSSDDAGDENNGGPGGGGRNGDSRGEDWCDAFPEDRRVCIDFGPYDDWRCLSDLDPRDLDHEVRPSRCEN